MRPLQLTGDDEAVTIERPGVLWEVLKLIEEVTSEIALGRQPRIDQAGTLFDGPQQHEEIKVTVAMVLLATVKVDQLLDPSRRRGGWLKLPGGRAAAGPGGLAEDEVRVGGGERAEGTEADSTKPEADLWAIRESLSLAEMFVSTADRPQGLAAQLVDLRTREFGEDNLHLIRAAGRLARSACATVLSTLENASKEAGELNRERES